MREFEPPQTRRQLPRSILYVISFICLVSSIALLATGLIYISKDSVVWGSTFILVFALIITALLVTPLRIIKMLAITGGLISIPLIVYQYLFIYFGNTEQIKLGLVVSIGFSTLLFGSHLINKDFWYKIFGSILILFASAGILVAAVVFPASELMQFIINFTGCTITFIFGCYLITRQGLFFRFWGVAIIIASVIIVFSSGIYSFTKYIQPIKIEGVAEQEMLNYVNPILDNMWQGYNEKNYDKYSQDFSSDMKEAANLKSMSDINDVLGSYIKRDFISGEKQGNTISANFLYKFSKKDEMSFHFEFIETKGKHYINAMSAQ